MNDKIIEALKQFLDYRDNVSTIDRFAPYNWYQPPGGLSWFTGYDSMLKEYSRVLTNSINDLLRYISNIEALKVIIDGCDDDTQYKIIVEFVSPFATLAINMPSAIRDRFIYSISHLCHQSNLTKDHKNINKFPPEKDIKFAVADEHCSL